MSIALDIGAHGMRSLRRAGNTLLGRRFRGAYAQLPESHVSRRLLKQLGMPHVRSARHLLVLGEWAEELSRLFRVPLIPLLPGGELPHGDPQRRQMLGTLIEGLLPEPRIPGEICCMSRPGSSADRDGEHRERNEFLRQVVRLRGYTPIALPAATAVVLAELTDRQFTGVGIAWGAAGCETSLVHCGRELRRRWIPVGGHRIDEELLDRHRRLSDSAAEPALGIDEVRRRKETFRGSLDAPVNREGVPLAESYRRVIHEILRDAAAFLAAVLETRTFPEPTALVIGGGPTRIRGFGDRFRESFARTEFPLPVDELRIADPSEYLVARGCLIQAELEEQTANAPRRAA